MVVEFWYGKSKLDVFAHRASFALLVANFEIETSVESWGWEAVEFVCVCVSAFPSVLCFLYLWLFKIN